MNIRGSVPQVKPKDLCSGVKLFGSVSRARILGFLYTHVGRTFYQREIVYEAGLSLRPVQRELNNLMDLGIVRKHETRNKAYYDINANSPLFKPLSEICSLISD